MCRFIKIAQKTVSGNQLNRNYRKSIRKLQKKALIAERVKRVYRQTKDKAVHSVYAEENSSTEYSAELLERGEEKVVHVGSEMGTKVMEANLAKSTWKKRKQIELVTQKTLTVMKSASEKVELIFESSLKAVLKASRELMAALGIGGSVLLGLLIILIMLGSAILFFGDGASTEYTVVSEEVQQYDQLIRLYTKEYDMMDYVDLVKAVMMQESGGKGLDPMQASEGSFNTKYPKEQNGITDPEYSIACGVQELKAALEAAGAESPVDMEKIKLALQGYNMGSGYISWAIEKDGGYTLANAIEFSKIMIEKLGWERYGDTEYVPHVLRYYPFNGIASGSGSSDLVEVALSQVGNVGGKTYWSWYGFNSRVEWCACFVSWCANECGYIEDGTMLKFSYCQTGADWFKSKGRWQSRDYTPVAGDIIFFDWEGDGHTDHVGIVERCDGNLVYIVEGNSGDSVKLKKYAIENCVIYGYGILVYQ